MNRGSRPCLGLMMAATPRLVAVGRLQVLPGAVPAAAWRRPWPGGAGLRLVDAAALACKAQVSLQHLLASCNQHQLLRAAAVWCPLPLTWRGAGTGSCAPTPLTPTGRRSRRARPRCRPLWCPLTSWRRCQSGSSPFRGLSIADRVCSLVRAGMARSSAGLHDVPACAGCRHEEASFGAEDRPRIYNGSRRLAAAEQRRGAGAPPALRW